ncbi:Reverse transcriptase domain-containing protein [Abeliophyllum distichum]|uniref:Reverse transcriptase domain-containing protein n=1 Tax=Abeliophyllum distichum TaxID=126358 RepID=A0ABD1U080_9LAMI
MNTLYWELCGKQDHLKDIAREEFFKLKCCSYNPKDLNKHFENAVRCIYLIGGMDDPNINQAYLESIPQPLGQEILRVIEMRGQSLGTTSIGELHNMVLRTLKKLCNQQQDEQSPDTIFILEEETDDSLSNDSDDESFSEECNGIQVIGLSLSVPMIDVKIFSSKYDRPIIVAGLFNTGTACSILNPTVLPSPMWKSHRQIFQATNNEYFSTEIISKPVTIQFFPNCSIYHKLLGSSLPGKDIVIGFDIIQQLWAKRFIPKHNGLQYKSHFLPYIQPTTYFFMSSLHSLTELLIRNCCAESHTDFLTKCTNPLLIKQEFFVSLPFQLNEDVNPTKASHTGMSPEHVQLATTELAQLQAEALIEPTNSQWACQAFYVNKTAEQVRGKMRLVIDYKLLNHFLADDKFPLPNRKALFANLSIAKIFSNFDFKAGFWKLRILPSERHKTGFCISNVHYQWTVLPFELKTSSSLFQKAITRIYHPIMKSALVYIDDILLFSPDESFHSQLLSDLHELTKQYGVMLAQKKMVIGVPEINFLGMHIKDGQYSLQPHVGQELLKFPDANISKKEVQQFLSIVNYMADFIDHLSTTIKPLQNMLKNNAPAWSEEQTKAIQEIKQKVHGLPALSIPTDGKRILQTDASDLYWAAVLLEEKNGKRSICGYKSDSFSEAESITIPLSKKSLQSKNESKNSSFI